MGSVQRCRHCIHRKRYSCVLKCELTRRQSILSIACPSVRQISFLTTNSGLRTMNLMIWVFGPLSLVFVGMWLLLSVDALLTALS